MIKQIGLIAVVAIGLALLIPGTNVQAIFSHHHSHLYSTGGIGLGSPMLFITRSLISPLSMCLIEYDHH